MIIEIVGPPGSGKSTVRNLIIEKLSAQSLRIKDLNTVEKEIIKYKYSLDLDSGWLQGYLGKLKLYSTIFSSRTYLGSLFRRPVDYFSRPKRLGYYWYAKDIMLSSYYQRTGISHGYHYFSNEGLLQHLVSLRVFANKDQNDLYQLMNDTIDINNIIVIRILIDPVTGLERLEKRGIPNTWPFYCRTSKRVKIYNDRYHKRIDELVRELKECGVKIYEIDTSRSWEKVKAAVDVCSKNLVSDLGNQNQ